MKREIIRTISYICLVFSIIYLTYRVFYLWKQSCLPIVIRSNSEIPSIEEIQKRLSACGNDRYDPGPIDGKIGPRTIRAWRNYIFDQYANRYIAPFGDSRISLKEDKCQD